jgi:hypothetical protein
MYHTDFIGQVPEVQPMNFQYKKPAMAPITVKANLNRFILFFIQPYLAYETAVLGICSDAGNKY